MFSVRLRTVLFLLRIRSDIFSSLLSGAIVKGASLEKAVSLAVNLTTDCIEATLPDKDTYWYGVSFESCMGKIAQEAAEL